jgi:hypothetical protein
MTLKTSVKYLSLFLIFLLAFLLRIYNINFGLPQSFHADEPEFVELAIKYTYEFRDIVANNNWYKFIPVSFVYGTFPVYIFTVLTMLYTKIANFVHYPITKEGIYVFLRVVTALVSSLSIFPVYFLAKKVFERGAWIGLFAAFLAAINWKSIAHGHYVNADAILYFLYTVLILLLVLYLRKGPTRLITFLLAAFFGLSVGTKITAGLIFPLILYAYFVKKDLRGFLVFVFASIGFFVISNPFSLVFSFDFVYRIYSMLFKEAGFVTDSVDFGYFKYIFSLSWIVLLMTRWQGIR